MRFGIHMPQKGGFKKNVKRAVSIGCNTIQIFPGNPTAWKPSKMDPQEIKSRKLLLKEKGINPLIIHTPYLINLASPRHEIREKSIALLQDTATRADFYGAPYVVMHPGSHGGKGVKEGIALLRRTLEDIMECWPSGVMLLLENTAGGGSLLGGRFSQFSELAKNFSAARLGFCLDTAHAWAAGYDFSTSHGVEESLEEFHRYIGLDRLHVIHANDVSSERGSHRDRHAHIGEGKIGMEGFVNLLRRKWPEDLPVILETPEMGSEYDQINLERLKKCA